MTARIVPPSEGQAVREGAPARDTLADILPALLTGEMVHFDDRRSHFNASAIRRFGRRLRTRDDDNGGRYYWTEPID
jgi:hypothetical protein